MGATSRGRVASAGLATVVLAAGLFLGCADDEGDTDSSTKSKRSTTSTEPDPTTTTTLATTARLADAACADEPSGIVAGPVRPIQGSDVVEASGIAVDPGPTGTVWLHNDSGDTARVFSVTDAGVVNSHDVPGAEAVDWEDMAMGPDGRLYVGDIGDNALERPSVVVYRFPAPDPTTGDPAGDVARLTLTYPDGPHNAESLMIDPVDERIVVISKGGGQAGVFSAPLAFEDGDEAELERVARVRTGAEGLAGQITAADMSADGTVILVRTHGGGLLFRRPPGTSIEEAFARDSCPIPVGKEGQGEAIAFTDDGGYMTIGEGVDPALTPFMPAG